MIDIIIENLIKHQLIDNSAGDIEKARRMILSDKQVIDLSAPSAKYSVSKHGIKLLLDPSKCRVALSKQLNIGLGDLLVNISSKAVIFINSNSMKREIRSGRINSVAELNAHAEILHDAFLNNDTNTQQNSNAINYAESTHTSSVHRTAASSAQRLYLKFKSYIDSDEKLHKVLANLRNWVQKLDRLLPDTRQMNQTAKRCIERLITIDGDEHGTYIEPISHLSIKQVLALTWLAINNIKDKQLHDQALRVFAEGLYEIQRCKNIEQLAETGKKDNFILPDQPSCPSGTFNKLIEKLSGGLCNEVEIQFITRKIASYKLPKVVILKAHDFILNKFSGLSSKNISDLEAIEKLMEKIIQEGVETIWDTIKLEVTNSMFEEFGSLYASKDHPDFLELIEQGLWVDINQDIPVTLYQTIARCNIDKTRVLINPAREAALATASMPLSTRKEEKLSSSKLPVVSC